MSDKGNPTPLTPEQLAILKSIPVRETVESLRTERDALADKLRACEETNTALEALAGKANELQVERDALKAEVERLERLRAWDEAPATLPGGLMLEYHRLDRMWQTLVAERDQARARVEELDEYTVGYGKERVASLNACRNPFGSYEPDIYGAKADAVEEFTDDIRSGAHLTPTPGKGEPR